MRLKTLCCVGMVLLEIVDLLRFTVNGSVSELFCDGKMESGLES